MIEQNQNILLFRLSLDDILFYLKRLGWIITDSKFKNYKFVKSPPDKKGTILELPLPTKPELNTYEAELSSFITKVASILKEQPDTLVQKIKQISSDLVFIKVLDPLVVRDSIALGLAEKIIGSLHLLFRYSAKAVEEIKPHFSGPLGDKSNEFAAGCRFAHTFKGSFGITIESPLNLPSIGLENLLIETPFERKVLERFFKGLTITELAVENNSSDIIVENYTDGFNSNMCDALVTIAQGLNRIDIEYQAGWSPLVYFDPNRGIKTKIKLNEKSLKLLSDASRHLKPTNDEKDINIVGFVTALRAPVGFFKDEESQRLVEIEGTMSEGQPIKVTTQLTVDDYYKAIEAHKSNWDIKISGRLKKTGKRWVITTYSDFIVRKP